MMDFWLSLGFSFFLILSAAALLAWQFKSWHTTVHVTHDAKELDFHLRQFRRRMQCSVMLMVLAAAVFMGQWITAPPILVILFWSVTLLIVAWLAVLAVTDIIMTVNHFQGLRADCMVEQAKLNAAAKRLRAVGGNGKPRGDEPLGN